MVAPHPGVASTQPLDHRSVESTVVYLRLHVEIYATWVSPPKERFLLGGAAMKEPVAFTSPIGPLITRYFDMKRALGRSPVKMAYSALY
jgi:hypothetical protein